MALRRRPSAGSSPSHAGYVSRVRTTGIGVKLRVQSFGVIVMIAKLHPLARRRTGSLPQPCQRH
jgi:hypothetical protein